MRLPRRLNHRGWLLVPLAAVCLLVWTDTIRIRHIEVISAITREAPVIDTDSPTGYAFGLRNLVGPDRNIESYQWIMQTQQMFADGEWRLRHVDTDNAPLGRGVQTPSATRWWLGLVAWVDHRITGQPVGLSVERAAFYADPLIHLLVLLATTFLVARLFGPFPAALVSIGIVALFPFSGGFQPGSPTSHGMASACALWSVLLLAAGLHLRNRPGLPVPEDPDGALHLSNRGVQLAYSAAGVFGGLGLWIDLSGQRLITTGIILGGFLMTWIGRRLPEYATPQAASPTPWRAWALGGAATCCAIYLLEFAPDQMEWLPSGGVHPIYALGLLGAGELLHWADDRIRFGQWFRSPVQIAVTILAGLVLTGTILILVRYETRSFLNDDLFAWRLTNLPDSPVAPHLLALLAEAGFTPMIWALLLPLLVFIPAFWMLFPEKSTDRRHLEIALLLVPALAMGALASVQLNAWNLLDAVILALMVVLTTPPKPSTRIRTRRWVASWSVFAALLFISGLPLLIPPARAARPDELTSTEATSLIERNLAHWLARRTCPERAVVLAPPGMTAALIYYGSIRGIGTLYPENHDGRSAAVRMARSTSNPESLALLENRQVTHIIMPSWDPALFDYTRLGSGNPGGNQVAILNRWDLPPWVRPVVYRIQQMTGWGRTSVTVLEIGEEQEEADAVSRLAEYFLEMGQSERAAELRSQLQNYPASLGALAALAQIEMALGDTTAFNRTLSVVAPYAEGGAARSMPWDRRISLAIVLAQGRKRDLAREQLQQCLDTMNGSHLRSLTPNTLYRFQLLCRRFDLEITDPVLQARALELLPPELRARLDGS